MTEAWRCEGEQVDDLQLGGLRILQKKRGFRYGMDAVLLSDFAGIRQNDVVVDFGTGTGILPLLLYGRGKGARFEAFELQQSMASMAARTMEMNGLSQTVRVHAADVTQSPTILPRASVDAIVCNPPYGTPGNTLHSPIDSVDLSRHQQPEGLLPWWKSAYQLLRGHGRISLIYPAPRMLELMELLEEAHLTPKRFRLVYPRADKPANLVLVEAVKDARPLLHPMPPLIVYGENGDMTDEVRKIYHMEEKSR